MKLVLVLTHDDDPVDWIPAPGRLVAAEKTDDNEMRDNFRCGLVGHCLVHAIRRALYAQPAPKKDPFE